jgi:hypothetical protein
MDATRADFVAMNARLDAIEERMLMTGEETEVSVAAVLKRLRDVRLVLVNTQQSAQRLSQQKMVRIIANVLPSDQERNW